HRTLAAQRLLVDVIEQGQHQPLLRAEMIMDLTQGLTGRRGDAPGRERGDALGPEKSLRCVEKSGTSARQSSPAGRIGANIGSNLHDAWPVGRSVDRPNLAWVPLSRQVRVALTLGRCALCLFQRALKLVSNLVRRESLRLYRPGVSNPTRARTAGRFHQCRREESAAFSRPPRQRKASLALTGWKPDSHRRGVAARSTCFRWSGKK